MAGWAGQGRVGMAWHGRRGTARHGVARLFMAGKQTSKPAEPQEATLRQGRRPLDFSGKDSRMKLHQHIIKNHDTGHQCSFFSLLPEELPAGSGAPTATADTESAPARDGATSPEPPLIIEGSGVAACIVIACAFLAVTFLAWHLLFGGVR